MTTAGVRWPPLPSSSLPQHQYNAPAAVTLLQMKPEEEERPGPGGGQEEEKDIRKQEELK